MDPSKYKQTTTSRGLLYNYYFTPSSDSSKPTILLLHGFPSTASDWAGLVPQLEAVGYGLIVPDMLGYGGTAKPVDATAYVGSKIARDCVDVLDAEGVSKAVVIGHDWGANATSKLASFFPERFEAFGFIAVGYSPPSPGVTWAAIVDQLKRILGYEPWGYLPFMASDESAKLIEGHMDSFMALAFAKDVNAHKDHICPPGAMQIWLKQNRTTPLLSSAIATPEWAADRKRNLLEGGVAASLCWYKVVVHELASEDDKDIPREHHVLTKPIFFGACTYDAACPPKLGDTALLLCAEGPVTRHEYAAGHWPILTHYEALGKDLLEWLAGL
ncbi:Alpha/Beta hydrolase protein [Vararia minispora EC-137]|uniref:Alpha/Beta hydrolase protein n=1 Tax=Vararia minispora EC-137 TaxID=1314806 RepID=A0ACB8QZR1_9AGAM|nr:Alpha/Beta hydrolase protein [Vararia minispora EC-137]